MRTRFLNKMTSEEVEQYLKYNDILFVPVGTVENHGSFPMDVRQILSEAIAKLFAEEGDGLIAASLPYFFAGETGRDAGTVEIAGKPAVKYLKALAISFLNQGFRRQVYITDQGPIYVMMGNHVIDFFDETKVPISYINLPYLVRKAMENDESIHIPMYPDMHMDAYYEELLAYGAYEILNRKKELVIEPGAVLRTPADRENIDPDAAKIGSYGGGYGAVGFYEQDKYGDFGAFPDEATRDRVCAEGAELLIRCCRAMDIRKYLQHLQNLDNYTNTEIKQRYGKNLPKNRWSEWA